jgi:hypothetical protein
MAFLPGRPGSEATRGFLARVRVAPVTNRPAAVTPPRRPPLDKPTSRRILSHDFGAAARSCRRWAGEMRSQTSKGSDDSKKE